MTVRVAIAENESSRLSGGGRAMLANMRDLEIVGPDLFAPQSTPGSVELFLRNVVPWKWVFSGDYILLPQNAWPWTNDGNLTPYERARRAALRVASEVCARRAGSMIRIGEAIPPLNRRFSGIVPHVLDRGFERAAKLALSGGSEVGRHARRAVVCVGSMDCYRNLERLLAAFEAYRQAGGQLTLLLGGTGLHLPKHARPAVVVIGRSLAREEMMSLLVNAHAAIFPSLVESSAPFGVLEGIELCQRVAVSDIPGHREATTRTERSDIDFFDPRSVLAIISALHRLEAAPSYEFDGWYDASARRHRLRLQWQREMASAIIELLGT